MATARQMNLESAKVMKPPPNHFPLIAWIYNAIRYGDDDLQQLNNARPLSASTLIPRHDIFQLIRNDPIHEESDLSQRTRTILEQGRSTLGGIMLIHAPTINERKLIIRAILEPFLRSRSNPLVVILTPKVEVADAMAADIANLLVQLQSEGKVADNRYGFRIDTRHAEHDMDADCDLIAGSFEDHSLGLQLEASKLADFLKGTNALHLFSDLLHAVPRPYRYEMAGARNPPADLASLDRGPAILKLMGTYFSPDAPPVDRGFFKYKGMLQQLLRVQHWGLFEKSDIREEYEIRADCIRHFDGLWKESLKHISFVVGTTVDVLKKYNLPNIAHRECIVILDDARRQSSDDLKLLFDTEFTNLAGLIQIADCTSIRPRSLDLNEMGRNFLEGLCALEYPVVSLEPEAHPTEQTQRSIIPEPR